MLFECEICGTKTKVNGIWSHIRGHKLNKNTYFNTPEKIKYLELLKKENKHKIREQSPLCMEFYIKKYGEENAQNEFNIAKELRNKKVLEGLDKKFSLMSKEEKELYNKEKANKSKETLLSNIMLKYNVDDEEAYNIYCNQRKECSPRNVEYYLKKGYKIEDAENEVSLWQKKCSPRCVEYYEERGYTLEESKELVKKSQDNNSYEYLKSKGLNDEEILNYRKKTSAKCFATNLKKLGITFDEFLDFKDNKKHYYRVVWYYTNKTINSNIIKNIELRGSVEKDGYHLDHMYSISEGFKNNVSPELIASFVNLKMIPAKENIAKNYKCSITLDELILKKEEYENSTKI